MCYANLIQILTLRFNPQKAAWTHWDLNFGPPGVGAVIIRFLPLSISHTHTHTHDCWVSVMLYLLPFCLLNHYWHPTSVTQTSHSVFMDHSVSPSTSKRNQPKGWCGGQECSHSYSQLKNFFPLLLLPNIQWTMCTSLHLKPFKKGENGGWQQARETDDGKRQQRGEQRWLAQSDSVFVCPTASGHETRL